MIRALHLRDFKSFCDVEVPLGPFTLVVGTNASGKSNLRDALRFLHGVGLGYSLADIFGDKYGAGGVRQWAGIRGGIKEAARQGRPAFEVACDFGVDPRGERDIDGWRYEIKADLHEPSSGPTAETRWFRPGSAPPVARRGGRVIF